MTQPFIRVEFKASPDRYTALIDANIDKITTEIQQQVIQFVRFVQEKIVKPHTPVKTGRLRRSIELKVDKRYRSLVIIRCYAGRKHPVPYAWIVEEGAGEHMIYPVKGYYLKFEGTNDWAGKTVFTPEVSHPGFGGYIMFKKGFIAIKTHLPKVLLEGLKSLPFQVT